MEDTANQTDRNDKEWSRRANWFGPRWLGLYHAPLDSRNWVPKPVRWLGWTVNLAQPGGRRWGLLLVLALAALTMLALRLV